MNIELKILDFIQTLHIPILDKIMVWITSLGDAGMIWILLTAIFLIMLKSMTRMQLLCLLRFTPLRRNVTAATGTLIF